MDLDQQLPQLPQPEVVVLNDGVQVSIRPIQPEDAIILKSGFQRLSQESIYYRFMSDKRYLTDEEARRFASVDYRTRMAFIATALEDEEEQLTGVARYEVLLPDRPDTAEAAIVVSDSFQRRGLGRLLMKRLLDYAHAQGVHYLRAEILIDNHRILKLIESGGLPYEKRYNEGTWEVLVDIRGWQ
jgi:acetyltransferase